MPKPTIFAVSSGIGRAGVAVIRLSGPSSSAVVEALCGSLPVARRASLRRLTDPASGDIVDEGLVLWFPAPHSFTGEDAAELHVHGSVAVVERMLAVLGRMPGLAAAEPGAFSRRAFGNGRLDLVEVEGLADLMAAETEAQRKLALRLVMGEASSRYESWRAQLVAVGSRIAAAIDFADEDGVAEAALADVRPRLEQLRAALVDGLATSQQAAAVRRGLSIVVAGAPNVGKSSLVNRLARREAAIVSPVAGTTRDVVEAQMVIAGAAVALADTAGLRAANGDDIEVEGMARARRAAEAADILVWVVAPGNDAAVPPRTPDVIVHNKADLDSILPRNESADVLAVSALTGVGLDALRARLEQWVAAKSSDLPQDGLMVRARHQLAVAESIRFLNDALLQPPSALELVAEDVRKATETLAQITGQVDVEDYLDQIFREFCIGK